VSEIERVATAVGLSARQREMLAALLAEEGIDLDGELPIVPLHGQGDLPLSFSQQRLWFLQRLEPESPFYNIAVEVRLGGALDLPVLGRALAEVTRRHEVLRSAFVELDSGPRVRIAAPRPVHLQVVDLSALPAAAAHRLAGDLTLAEARRGFDLTAGILLRILVLKMGRGEHRAVLTLHHVVADGWSMGVLVQEVGALYGAFLRGGPSPLPELPFQYADFAAWQRSWLQAEVLEKELAYWRAKLEGVAPVLELPFDHPRPAQRSDRGATRILVLPAELTESVERLSRRQGVSLFMNLLAAFAALLGRYTGQQDLMIGYPVANRDRSDIEGMIGLFLNTLVLRVDLSGHPAFGVLLGRVRDEVLEAQSHAQLPFERLVEELRVERSLSYNPLFQVLFVLQNTPASDLEIPGLAVESAIVDLAVALFDLSCRFEKAGDTLLGRLEYSRDLFDGTTIERLAGHYTRLLAGAMAEPQRPLSQLPLLSPGERHQILAEWNDRATVYPGGVCLHELVAAQAARTPDAVAASFESEQLTCRELARRAGRLARHLAALGVGPEGRVGVLLERSLEMIVGLLGVLEAGAAYVPLEPGLPAERLGVLVESAGLSVILTVEKYAALIPSGSARAVLLDADWRDREDVPAVRAAEGNLAYVLYTSGSTGIPKGVMIPHQGIVNRLLWMQEAYGLTAADRVLQKTPFGFDISLWELFWPLLSGARLVFAQPEGHKNPLYLADRIAREGITTLHFVPSMLEAFLEVPGLESLTCLRRVVASGEALPPRLVERFFARLGRNGGAELHNLYGPTEASVDVSCWPCVPAPPGSLVPIGRPIGNHRLYVADRWLGAQPLGVPGELLLGGPGLARGYLGRPELTAAAFVPDPFGGAPGGRLYRTGDLVRQLPDGTVHYLSRLDYQVKIRGVRIELGEIEAALVRQPGVREAVVLVREDASGDRRLVAYVVLRADRTAPEPLDLWSALRRSLPEAMVPTPSDFVLLESLPLTANGKVDRRALARIAPAAVREAAGFVAPRGPVEEGLAAIWAEVLGADRVERVGSRDDFFALGGHSLLATQVISRVRDAFGVELPLRALFEAPTLAALAARIAGEIRGPQAPATGQVSREAALVLSFAQRRLWFLDQLAPGSPVYNVPAAVELTGDLKLPVLAAALAEVVRRHEALRTTFQTVDGEPAQVVAGRAPSFLPVVDLHGLRERKRKEEVDRLTLEEARRPFDLGDPGGGLLRTALLRLETARHAVLLTMHHIVSDGWSMGVLVREIGALYAAFLAGRPSPLPELAVQYADFAAWQRRRLSGALLESELAWWRGHLAGMPPALELPADHPRPAASSGRGAVQGFALDREDLAGLTALSHRHGATLFMTLLAGFAGLLQRITGEDDLVVGTPIAGRTRMELEPLIGFFVNTLVLRLDLSGDPGFVGVLGRARETTLAAYAHQEVPFERLVEELAPERDLSRPPLVQVLFVLQNAPLRPLELPGLALTASPVSTGTAKLDLTCTLTETERGLEGTLEYSRDLFEAPTMARLTGFFLRLLTAAVAEPQRRLSELPLLSAVERQQIREWGTAGMEAEPGAQETLAALFEARVRQAPGATAVSCEGCGLSYGELNVRANRLAHRLRQSGVGPEVRVGLCVERSPELLVGVLGIVKSGGAYLPLDPSSPRERLALLVEDAGARVLVATERTLTSLPQSGITICLDGAAGAELARWPETDPPAVAAADHAAYVIYTSGSTGRPKGVLVTHANVVRLLRATEAWLGFGPHDVWTLFHSYTFDFSVWEIWGALFYGGRLVMVPYLVSRTPESFYDLLAGEGVTVLNQTPTAFAELLRVDEDPARSGALAGLRLVIFGGEALVPSRLSPWFARHGDERPRLVNMYGITETTVHVTYRPLGVADAQSGPGQRSVIGRPIPDLSVHVVDPTGSLAPIGVPGELVIGGDGLSRGYLGRPDLTAERFVPDALCGAGPGSRLYRSGDRVRFLPTGELEYLGRLDHQVKIRGFRIEPGEIEAALLSHAGVRQAVVLAFAGEPGGGRLVAFVVPRPEQRPEVSELRRLLACLLPEHLVPAAFVLLDALPRTANGKLDRKALAKLRPERTITRAALRPRTQTEERLAAIFAAVLGLEQVGVEDNFFELGGHSLLATQVALRIQGALGVELPVRAVFEAPTVAALASRLASPAGAGEGLSQAARTLREGRLPLSFAQQRLWFLDQLAPGSAAYNIPVAIELTGDLKLAVLAAALAEVVRRHEALRTTFQVVDGEQVQVVAARAELGPSVIDLRSLPAGTREEEANRLTTTEARRPFDLGNPRGGSLLRVALLRLAGEQHVALLTMHHIVSDGWSMGVLIREVSALYTACLGGRPSPLPELPIQYRDYALWQRSRLTGEVLEQEIASWREALAGIPVLQLPTDRPRPPVQTFRGAVRRFEVPGATTAALKALGQRQGGTLFMVLLAAFAALLHRYTGQDDVAIGSPAANRTRSQLEGLIGFFVNTLVLRIDLSGAPSFAALFARVRRASVDAFSHQELPFEKVVFELQPERNLSVSPLFQVMFSFQNAPMQSLSLPGLTLRPFAVETRTAKFDLTLDIGESAGGLAGSLEHNIDLFDRTTVDRMLGHFGRLLEAVTAEPGTSVADLPLLSAGERNQLLVEWNATDRPVPAGLVHEWIAAQAARTPEAVAVTFGAASLTYRELDRRANGLAWRLLLDLGVGPEVRVGIALERSLEMVVGVLAVLKAGGAYVPLDPSYPAERLAFMVEDSGLATVLRSPLRVAEAAEAPHAGVGADNAAYVIYTSGSTGRPKGVQISHGALANFLASMAERLGIGARDVLLSVTSLSFDIAGLELYLPLTGGGRIVLASREEAADGQRLQELTAGATVLQATPATWRLLLDSRWQGGEGLKALCGGEALSPSLASSLLERVGALWNCYGPTETTIWSTVEEVVQIAGAVAIGRPIANTEAYVLDRRGAPVPLGAPGELVLGGAGVARGYLGRPDLTAERFVPNPFGAPGSRMYRTGDLVRYRADGALGFLGRIDHQVKLRGFRVELGEVEAVLASHPAVRASAVVALADRREDLRLVAYVVVNAEASVPGTPAELRAFLKKALPDSMVPSSFVSLAALPLTPSGKVDRRALPAPDGASLGSGAELAAPATAVEEVLAEIWRKVLGVTRVGRHDNFFDLGGHSLLLAELRQRLQERFGRELSMVEMFRHATVAAMAEHLAAGGAAEPPRPPEIPDRSVALRQGRERLKQRGERQARRAGERLPGGAR
jgi:amino acid adenylation domain-containing protein